MANKLETKYVLTGEDRTKAAFDSIKANMRSTQNGVGNLTRSFGGIAAAMAPLAALASVAGIVKFGANAITAADRIGEMSQALNISVEALSQYEYGAGLAGIESEQFGTALRKMNDGISEAASVGAGSADVLKKLGLNARDLSKLTADQKFDAIAEALSQVENASDRATYAGSVFGDKLGAKLLPMINGGTAGINAFKKEADALGITLSGSVSNQAGIAADKFDTLRAQLRGVANAVLGEVLPSITSLLTQLQGLVASIRGADPELVKMIGLFVAAGIAIPIMTKGILALIATTKAVGAAWAALRIFFTGGGVVAVSNPVIAAILATVIAITGLILIIEKLNRTKVEKIDIAGDAIRNNSMGQSSGNPQLDNIVAGLAKTRGQPEAAAKKIAETNKYAAAIIRATALGIETTKKEYNETTLQLDTVSMSYDELVKKIGEVLEKNAEIAKLLPSEGLLQAALANGIETTETKYDAKGILGPSVKSAQDLMTALDKKQEETVAAVQSYAMNKKAVELGLPFNYIVVSDTGEITYKPIPDAALKSAIANELTKRETDTENTMKAMAKPGTIQLAQQYGVATSTTGFDKNGGIADVPKDQSSLEGDVLSAIQTQQQATLTVGQQMQQMFTDLGTKSQQTAAIFFDSFMSASSGIADVMGGALTQVSQKLMGLNNEPIMIGQAFGNMVASVIGDLGKMILKMWIVSLLAKVLGFQVGKLPAPATLLGGGTLGGRAAGGPIGQGQSYWVGENGRELFTPRVAGTITPEKSVGGNVTVTNHITIDAKGDIFNDKLRMSRLAEAINDAIETKVKKTYYQPTAA